MADIDRIATYDPERADSMRKFIFSRDTAIDRIASTIIPQEDIKAYPGSILGPEPEDDPDGWAKWYYSNQPLSAYKDGKLNLADIGAKVKFIKPKEEVATVGYGELNHVYESPLTHFFGVDDGITEKGEGTFSGTPEWALFDKENEYNLKEGQ